ncbi:hypothetical protein HNQ91_005334 [Filimonas zeae]|uniref:Outer membrane protein beta-barrel domain-containing protein n=1 Tax=Filimonas zeae TaxID=1737353 RepID=A0A917N0I6_9BACT|nr:porin family protein [Filimonas zeae]MDR6342250.1 hypothetical protein [Filimonas zeae]GGH80590.1 hypothetical protein GCM10011379_51680 [Filimonas zeae]
MKKSKLILMAGLAGFTMWSSANAQSTTTTTNTNPGGVWLRGSYSLANISTSGDGTVDNSNNLSTFNAGFIGDLPLNDMFSLQSGLFLQGKGAKASGDNFSVRFRPYYLQLPVNFAVKVPIGTDSRFFIGAGPFVSMGLFGKTTSEYTVAGVTTTVKNDIKFESVDGEGENDGNLDRLKRFEFGINGTAGVEAGRFLVGITYDWGLSKINQVYDNENNDKNKYRTLSLNLGFRLN